MGKKSKMIECKHCGAEIAASAKTCPYCGGKNKKPIYKKWWFWVLIVIILFGVIGGGSSDSDDEIDSDSKQEEIVSAPASDNESETASESVPVESDEEEKPVAQSAEEAYQEILTEYSEKLRAATPGLIEEYKAEAANNTAGLDGLAEISNEKIGKLAEISNDGVEKMAGVMYTTGSGSYDDYEAWAKKLMDVYTEEAGKISDAYIDSAK